VSGLEYERERVSERVDDRGTGERKVGGRRERESHTHLEKVHV